MSARGEQPNGPLARRGDGYQ